ncbi:MAG: MarR family transcriptional regulator [Thaumarchaeota archaeon]|nr:MarR family transcriptional regulator [Nitrososphaerota archaeon]MCL5318090.1 MarR family transcriptional regulator [Nitrososphaerota archaeon]
MIYFVNHLSPSTKLVLKVLTEKGQITQKDLIRETSLPKRTVNHAVRKLKSCNLLKVKYNFNDLRQKYYVCLTCDEECPIKQRDE